MSDNHCHIHDCPAPCPQCHQTDTRLVTLRHEMSLYACERCRIEFEIEEAE